jgi:hypothetical protein
MIHLLPLLRFRLAQLIDPGDCELPSNDRTRQKILLEEMDEDSVTRASKCNRLRVTPAGQYWKAGTFPETVRRAPLLWRKTTLTMDPLVDPEYCSPKHPQLIRGQ